MHDVRKRSWLGRLDVGRMWELHVTFTCYGRQKCVFFSFLMFHENIPGELPRVSRKERATQKEGNIINNLNTPNSEQHQQ